MTDKITRADFDAAYASARAEAYAESYDQAVAEERVRCRKLARLDPNSRFSAEFWNAVDSGMSVEEFALSGAGKPSVNRGAAYVEQHRGQAQAAPGHTGNRGTDYMIGKNRGLAAVERLRGSASGLPKR